MGRKLQLIVFLSLALNLLLIGLIIGYSYKGCSRDRHHDRAHKGILERVSPEQRKVFKEALSYIRHQSKQNRSAIRQERKNSIEILTAPQFNAEAYRKSMDQLHQLQGNMKGQLTEAVIQLASTLNQKDREALAAFLERGPKGSRKGDRRKFKNRHRESRPHIAPESRGMPPGRPPGEEPE